MEDSAGVLPGPAPIVRGDWLVTEIPGKPIAVRFNLDVVQRLGLAVREGFKSLPRRGLETGGLLIGKTRKESGRAVIDIVDFEPVESEHATGPSYLLSEADRRLLESRIAAREAVSKGPAVVGFYRSHTRRNFTVTLEDEALFSNYFRKANDIFLLVKSNDDGPPTCGVLIRENGKELSGNPVAQFPLDRLTFGAPPRELAAAPAVKAVPTVPAVIPAAAAVSQALAMQAVAAHAPAPSAVVPQASGRNGIVPAVQLDTLLGRWRLWLAIAAAAAIAIGIPWSMQRRADAVQGLGLSVANTGASLRVSWDHQASVRATRAILWIQDGPAEHRFDLDSKQLSQGSVSYWPTTGDVNFRLEWMAPTGKVIESVRAIGGPVSAAAIPAPPAPVVKAPPAPRQKTVAVSRPSRRSRTGSASRQSSRTFTAPDSAPGGVTPARAALPEPPAVQPARALPAGHATEFLDTIAPAKDAGSRDIPDPNFHVDVQPVPHLGRSIPLIGRRSPRTDYVAPVPIRKSAMLSLPHREVTHEVAISVKVYVNPSGKVDYSELVSQVPKEDSDLAALVIFAARRWEFEPAREGKDAVAGEVVLHYRFGPGARASVR